jgi:4-hydroxy-2-oxoglutarate aldolase
MTDKLNGIIIPIVTSFVDEKFSSYNMALNIVKWNKTDVKGYMALGSNGEFRSMDDNESFDVIKCVSDNRSSDKTLIVGTMRESTYQTKRFIEKISCLDMDYISLLTPHYFKGNMTDGALLKYFTDIADFSPKPILLYCAPGFANTVKISVDVLKQSADHPNIHGIKDTSSDMMESYCDACAGRDDFEIISGSLSTFLDGMTRGATGGVLSAGNYMPELCCRLYDMAANGGIEQAKDFNAKLQSLYLSTAKPFGVVGVKACMDAEGYFGGNPRLPILLLDDKTKMDLMNDFAEKISRLQK